MHLIAALTFAASLSLACGGSQDSSSTGPTPPGSTDTESTETTSPPATGVLAIGEASLTFVKPDGSEAGGMSMDATGALTAVHPETGETKNVGALSASGELQDADGKVFARIDEAGSVSVFKTHIREENGVEVSREEEWKTIGVIDANGSFMNANDQKSIAISDDGRIDLGRGAVKVNVSAPNLRRAAMFLMIASMSATTTTEGSASAPSTEAVPPTSK
jgi:hypothetical protein